MQQLCQRQRIDRRGKPSPPFAQRLRNNPFYHAPTAPPPRPAAPRGLQLPIYAKSTNQSAKHIKWSPHLVPPPRPYPGVKSYPPSTCRGSDALEKRVGQREAENTCSMFRSYTNVRDGCGACLVCRWGTGHNSSLGQSIGTPSVPRKPERQREEG